MRKGVCVQIGLDRVAEYSYLVYPDWRGRMNGIDKNKRIPTAIFNDIDEWEYIGVEQQPHSIAYLLTVIGAPARWVICRVDEHPEGFAHVLAHRIDPADVYYEVPQMMLGQLFHGLRLDYNPDMVDVLAMDIEGNEAKVLESHDWKVIPRFIAVEIHSFEEGIKERVDNVLFDKDYELIYTVPTNQETTAPTLESHYIQRKYLDEMA